MTERYESKVKPEKCTKCGAARIARILYGSPRFSEEMQTDLDTGRTAMEVARSLVMNPYRNVWSAKRSSTEFE
jgi:hypothetical protein